MSQKTLTLSLPSPGATSEFAQKLAPRLMPGDVLLLHGDVGAGKTHFARSLILTLLDHPEDIPSPTFTLVQTYHGHNGEIWHSDLYRLSDVAEVIELGLVDAFAAAICLVEWPDRLGDLAPIDALHSTFTDGADENTRNLTMSWSDNKWDSKLRGLSND